MTLKELTQHVAQFEGFRSSRYLDSGGSATVGFGFTGSCFKGGIVPSVIDRHTAELMLEDILAKTMNEVTNRMIVDWGYPVNINQICALTDFTYNLGTGNLKKLTDNGKRTLLEIADKIPAYCNCNGKQLAGLVKRRAWERDLFLKGSEVPEVNHTARELQELVNKIYGTDKLAIDGKLGQKSINAIYTLLMKIE